MSRFVGKSTLAATTLAVVALSALGCVANRQYTFSPSECAGRPDCEAQRLTESESPAAPMTGGKQERYRQSVRRIPCSECPDQTEKPCGYTLATVEFDDQGELWEPAQLEAVRQRLQERESSSIVLVFIHGWKNNASRYSEEHKNLASFKRALQRLARLDDENREIIGVFLAWRGNSAYKIPSLWVGQQLTIFGRRAIAGKVASVSASHALHRIVHWAKAGDHDSCADDEVCESVAVAVGHSLGAVILENILLRSLTVQTSNPKKTFPADLAVLVNSANPAILARRFLTAFEKGPVAAGGPECDQDSQKNCSGKVCECYKIPMIVSMTSPWDSATRFLLPVEGWLTSLFKNFRPYDESVPRSQAFYSRHAPGHIDDGDMLTHEVVYLDPETAGDSQAKGASAVPRKSVKEVRRAMEDDCFVDARCIFPEISEYSTWACDEEHGNRFGCLDSVTYTGCLPGSRYRIERISGYYPGSRLKTPNTREARNNAPYWVLRLPKRLISSHGDIFNGDLSALIAALVNLPGMAPDWKPEAKETLPDSPVQQR